MLHEVKTVKFDEEKKTVKVGEATIFVNPDHIVKAIETKTGDKKNPVVYEVQDIASDSYMLTPNSFRSLATIKPHTKVMPEGSFISK